MKSSPKQYLVAIILIMLFGLTSTTSAQQQSLTGLISSNGNMSMFNNALNQSNIPWLATGGPFTVVVPSNDAFNKLPAQARADLLASPNELRKLALYHILQGSVDTGKLAASGTFKTALGPTVQAKFWNGQIHLNDASVLIEGDRVASNGIVHVIDEILVPPNSALEATLSSDGQTQTSAADNNNASTTSSNTSGQTEAVEDEEYTGAGYPPLPEALQHVTNPTQNPSYVSGGIRPYWSSVYEGGNGCRGMTWVTHQIESGFSKVGADRFTNAWRGDTPCHQQWPMLCMKKGGVNPPANTYSANYQDHWSGGSVRATGYIRGSELTSEARANQICENLFGANWRMAEFHDALTGNGMGDGWYFWAKNGAPLRTRFWVSIFDQPANPWDSVISRTPPGPVAYGGSYFINPETENPAFEGWQLMNRNEGYQAGRGSCKGTTWVLLEQLNNGLTLVGADSKSNPYLGDSTCGIRHPVLCISVVGYGTPPNGNNNDYSQKWSAGAIQHTPNTYSGFDIGSRREANRICRATFGNGYRMASHHDGSLGTSPNGGWNFWGFGGGLKSATRYWVAVNDQNANPWNAWGY